MKAFLRPEQDAIATIIRDELADERLWQESLPCSADQLSCLAERFATTFEPAESPAGGSISFELR